ncbi:MAG: hypothetical protein NC084_13505 [Bacteroides sp.]|nr:hypothetical protein [Eubacterium sp.]MCM1419661.1 hypothetical protein [Roseburia sp.]MCM1463712.1 hypothetical protein [Bacteroides sp.]
MAITVGGIAVDKYVTAPVFREVFRARSCEYTLDGTAREDRLGSTKRRLELTFSMLPASVHNTLRAVLKEKEIEVEGAIGGGDKIELDGTYRAVEDEISTPILVVHNGKFYCQSFTVTLEEI